MNAQTERIPTMLTIRELAAETKAFGLSETAIRNMVKRGEIAHINAGRKVLINRERFIEFLNGKA